MQPRAHVQELSAHAWLEAVNFQHNKAVVPKYRGPTGEMVDEVLNHQRSWSILSPFVHILAGIVLCQVCFSKCKE